MSNRESSSESVDFDPPTGESNIQGCHSDHHHVTLCSAPSPDSSSKRKLEFNSFCSSQDMSNRKSSSESVDFDPPTGESNIQGCHSDHIYWVSCSAPIPDSSSQRKLDFNDNEYFMVTEQNSSQGDEAKKIHKHAAICRTCSQTFQTDDVRQMKCECDFICLVHASCAPQWLQQRNNKCNHCGEDIQNLQVTLSEYQRNDKKNSTRRRPWRRFFKSSRR